MVTQEQYEFAVSIMYSDMMFETPWKDLPQWARDIFNAVVGVVEQYDQQRYAAQAAEDPYFIPF